MIQTLWIDKKLPGLNEIIAHSKSQWRGKYNKLKKELEEHICYRILKDNIQPIKQGLFKFQWIEENRKRDPDNIAAGRKFILDSLVKMNVLKDDSQRYVAGWRDEFKINKNYPGVLVTMKDIG